MHLRSCAATVIPIVIFLSSAVALKLEEKEGRNCTPAAIYEFPDDGLTREQRRSGWVTIHAVLTCYCFILLSFICDDYFVPAIQTLVERLNLSEDVAGASFMAITSASPELFINCVGTFVTEGDIGVGTVVGSNVFNILAAPACCGLFTKMTSQFEYWSVLRDGLAYAISVIMLIVTLHDDQVYWYEALAFVLTYFVYIAVMYFDKIIHKRMDGSWLTSKMQENPAANHELEKLKAEETEVNVVINGLTAPETNSGAAKKSVWERLWVVLTCPITFSLNCTIPNCKKHPSLFPLALIMCMFWIGSTSYLLAWLITAIGDTIAIPDSVMGLSFLAIGSSMPEIVSCIIVSKQGQGVMGMSSALGANTFEVLLCLGLPWLIKTVFNPKTKGNHLIDINSSGLAYNATCLLSTLVFLYICLIFNRFRLNKKLGLICLVMYAAFLVIGTMIELNFFFPVNLPTCA